MPMVDLDRADAQRIALVDADADVRLTYRDLRTRVRSAADVLQRDRAGLVAIAGTRTAASVIAWLAALDAGHAVLWIDPAWSRTTADRLIQTYDPQFVIDALPPAGGEYEHSEHADLGRVWQKVRTGDHAMIHPALGALLATSGSTGSPRVARISRAALAHNAGAIVRGLALTDNDISIAPLPLAHAFGLSVLNSHLAAGATVVLSRASVFEGRFWRACAAHGVTSLAGVPVTFEWLQQLGPDRLVPPALTRMVQAGGRLAPHLREFWADWLAARGGDLRVMYGQTEATARIAMWPRGVPAHARESVGRVVADGHVQIDPETNEIVYRGPNVMMGYATTRSDLARGFDVDELRTGDLGRLDRDGFLYVTGRLSRIAKVAGSRVDLDDLERQWAGAVVAAVERDGRIDVFVERGSGPPDPAAWPIPAAIGLDAALLRVHVVERLPRSSAGKLLYSALPRTI
jgi:acyl-CoA synthetase (AMP-forming)/AMP-acid ligase II